jgi:heme/copper-type cytochrome/quinol oxidase subunit 2
VQSGIESLSGHVVGIQGQIFAVAGLVFVFAEGLIFWSILRRGPKTAQARGSALLEVSWSVIPVALFALVGVVTYRNSGRDVQQAVIRTAPPVRAGFAPDGPSDGPGHVYHMVPQQHDDGPIGGLAERLVLRPPSVVLVPEGVVR